MGTLANRHAFLKPEIEMDTQSAIVAIPLKGKTSIDVDLNELMQSLPAEAIREIMIQGLKHVLGAKMTKIAKELVGDIQAQAAKNLENLKVGVFGRASKPKGVSGAVMTEARRIARLLVKDELKRQKLKVSHYTAAEITAAANGLIDANPGLLKQAEENISARSAGTIKIDLGGLREDPVKVAKAEEAKAKKKAATTPASAGQLSAAKAGKSKPAAHVGH